MVALEAGRAQIPAVASRPLRGRQRQFYPLQRLLLRLLLLLMILRLLRCLPLL